MPDYSRTYTMPPVDRRAQYDVGWRPPATPDYRRGYGLFQDRGGVAGLSRGALTPTEAAAAGVTPSPTGGGFERDPYGRLVMSRERFDLMHGYEGGHAALQELANIAGVRGGGARQIRIAGEGGGTEARDGAFNVMVRRGPTGNITYTPVSGATSRSMARAGDRGISQRTARRKGGGYGLKVGEVPKGWKSKKKKEEGGGRAVGRAAQYQPGYNFDYDARGGYMPMTRQFARPNYLGLINWRI